MSHICIVGAGLCGSLLAVRLAQRGFTVSLFERRPDMRKRELDAGRSINLALSDRGWKALRMIGAEEVVRDLVIPMHGRMIHPSEGDTWLSPYSGRAHEHINSVSRPGLNKVLLDKAESYDNVSLYFDHRCTGVDPDSGTAYFEGPTGQNVSIRSDVIFGTDGAGSAVRQSLFQRSAQLRFDFSQQWLKHGYKELTIPPDEHGKWQLSRHALHIWPRQEFMLIALPNLDGSFTVTLFLAFEGDPGFDHLTSNKKVNKFFKEVFTSAHAHMPDLAHEFFEHPTPSLGTIKCYPWQVGGKVLLMGDAAHAIVPFYGQGMNCSMEDVVVLDGVIDETGVNWAEVLPKFQKIRKPDTDAIADLAIENYYEMRDHVDNPEFIKKRKLEMQLEEQFPEYSSKYNLVTFNEDIPYSRAKAQGNAQDKFLLEFCREHENIDHVDLEALFHQLQRL